MLQAIPHTPPPSGKYANQPAANRPAPVIEKDPLSAKKLCCYGGAILVALGGLVALPFVLADEDRKKPEVADTSPTATEPEAPDRDRAPRESPQNQRTDPPTKPPLLSLPADDQAKVNQAIAKGVKYLKQHPPKRGSPHFAGHQAGVQALWGLTLLECGVSGSDAQLQKIAADLRKLLPKLNQTYDLGLTILFFDRLGEHQDYRRIQTLALRLIAGQDPSGGWTYACPLLSVPDEEMFYVRLQKHRPDSPLSALEVEEIDDEQMVTLNEQRPVSEVLLIPDQTIRELPPALVPLHQRSFSTLGKNGKQKLTSTLRQHHTLKPIPPQKKLNLAGRTDNSNTQFAILGLWTARRYQIPMDQALILMVKRFRKSQRADGTWTYRVSGGFGASSDLAMTCTGMLGLAVGRGLIAEMVKPNGKANVPLRDKTLNKGMKALGKKLDEKGPQSWRKQAMNLYALWSLERVGVLYQRRHFGRTDWYREIALRLVKEQRPTGSWAPRGRSYPGTHEHLDTCFALLILKRSNLTPGLSERLLVVEEK